MRRRRLRHGSFGRSPRTPTLFKASLGSVYVYDVAVLPIAGPLADLRPTSLSIRLDQRRDDLDKTAQLGELDRQSLERICVNALESGSRRWR